MPRASLTDEQCRVGAGQEFRCSSKCSGEPLTGFKQENGAVLFALLKIITMPGDGC